MLRVLHPGASAARGTRRGGNKESEENFPLQCLRPAGHEDRRRQMTPPSAPGAQPLALLLIQAMGSTLKIALSVTCLATSSVLPDPG